MLQAKPTTTLGAQIERWYENAGGLDKAVNAAQESQKSRDPKVLDGLLWPKWQPGDVTERRPPVRISPPQEDDVNGARGTWDSGTNEVWVKDDGPHRQSTLEHELSHSAYMRNARTLSTSQKAAADKVGGWSTDHGEGKEAQYMQYLTDPTEVDVRLAEIKRHYAHHTGKLVDSPEEAQKAWKWWESYSRNFTPEANEDRRIKTERPEDTPTLHPWDFQRLDALPEKMKTQMMNRMPELVRSGDRIRELRRA